MIWTTNATDKFLVDGKGHVPAWASESDAFAYARARGVEVVPDPPLLHDLDLAKVAATRRNGDAYDALLSAWNLFSDLSNSVFADEFTPLDSASTELYDRLFHLAAVLPGMRRTAHILPSTDWSRLARLMDAGCRLFERVVVMRTSEDGVFEGRAALHKVIVYLRSGSFYIGPLSETTAGAWIPVEPCMRLRVSCTDAELGEAVVAALPWSRKQVPHPTDWKNLPDPLLDAAKLRSWATFSKGALSVDVQESDGQLTLTPLKNLGPREGFVGADAGELVVSTREGATEIGRELRRAFALAV